MLEIYDLFWKNKKCGELQHNTTKNEFKAQLFNEVNGEFPVGLFTINKLPEVGDVMVKRWFENRVAPQSRENIRDVLHAKGLQSYSPWSLFKANGGRNANDYCTIVLREIL